MKEYVEQIEETVDFLKKKIQVKPDIAVVLGSGLGFLTNEFEDKKEIDYKEIPGFAVSTIQGHAGKLIVGKLGGKNVIAMSGRFHLYEGHDVSKVVFPVRVFKKLGVENFLVTNAAGGVNRNFKAGDLMIITDHVGFFAPSPLKGENLEEFGPRFPDMSQIYNKELVDIAEQMAKKVGVNVKKGVYMYCQGPSYETPAEIRAADRLGVDAVGMSTVPEVIAANHAGMNILGISCITNMASGILPQPLSHDEVKKTAQEAGEAFCKLVTKIVENWDARV